MHVFQRRHYDIHFTPLNALTCVLYALSNLSLLHRSFADPLSRRVVPRRALFVRDSRTRRTVGMG